MNLEKQWEKAIKNTEIKRQKLQNLNTFKVTELPYLLLGESKVNIGDSVIRKGKISIDKPILVLPDHFPQFKGFDFKKELEINEDTMRSFLLMRGIRFPSLKYNNELYSLDVIEKSLKDAIKHYLELLKRKEDIKTGLIVGPEDCWQFSLLIYVATLVTKSVGSDIKNIIDKFRNKDD